MTAGAPESCFDTADRCAAALAEVVASILTEGVRARGQASLVVPGGTTPHRLYRALSDRPLEWGRIWITLTDERWLEPNNPVSNEHAIRRMLLQRAAADARWVGLKNASVSAVAGLAEAAECLARIPRPYDAVIVGMGEDGHVASLFPGAPADTGDALCIATRAPVAPAERISLTPRALMDTRRLFLLVGGVAKRDVLQRASRTGAVTEYPVRALLQQDKVPVEIYYYTA